VLGGGTVQIWPPPSRSSKRGLSCTRCTTHFDFEIIFSFLFVFLKGEYRKWPFNLIYQYLDKYIELYGYNCYDNSFIILWCTYYIFHLAVEGLACTSRERWYEIYYLFKSFFLRENKKVVLLSRNFIFFKPIWALVLACMDRQALPNVNRDRFTL
jgi:hypothetical protein